MKLLGTPSEKELRAMRANCSAEELPKLKAYPWDRVFPAGTPPRAMDLAYKLLSYDPAQRLTATTALEHPFLQGVEFLLQGSGTRTTPPRQHHPEAAARAADARPMPPLRARHDRLTHLLQAAAGRACPSAAAPARTWPPSFPRLSPHASPSCHVRCAGVPREADASRAWQQQLQSHFNHYVAVRNGAMLGLLPTLEGNIQAQLAHDGANGADAVLPSVLGEVKAVLEQCERAENDAFAELQRKVLLTTKGSGNGEGGADDGASAAQAEAQAAASESVATIERMQRQATEAREEAASMREQVRRRPLSHAAPRSVQLACPLPSRTHAHAPLLASRRPRPSLGSVAAPCRSLPLPAAPCRSLPRPATPCHAVPRRATPCHALPRPATP